MIMCLRYRHLNKSLWGWGGLEGLEAEGVRVEGVGGRGWGMEEVEGHVSGALRNKDLEFHICKVHTHIRTQYI